eukprot:Nk52_evm56s1810 gene=Nk52_evmTU56s1810
MHVIIKVPWKRPEGQPAPRYVQEMNKGVANQTPIEVDKEWTTENDMALFALLQKFKTRQHELQNRQGDDGMHGDAISIEWNSVGEALGRPAEQCYHRAEQLLKMHNRNAKETSANPSATATEIGQRGGSISSPSIVKFKSAALGMQYVDISAFERLIETYGLAWDKIAEKMELTVEDCYVIYNQHCKGKEVTEVRPRSGSSGVLSSVMEVKRNENLATMIDSSGSSSEGEYPPTSDAIRGRKGIENPVQRQGRAPTETNRFPAHLVGRTGTGSADSMRSFGTTAAGTGTVSSIFSDFDSESSISKSALEAAILDMKESGASEVLNSYLDPPRRRDV